KLTVEHSIGTIYLAQCVWILLPILPLTAGDLPGLSAGDWTLLILAASAAGFGQLSMNEGFRCLTVSTGASMQMLWPVMTALGGLAWFDERFTGLQIIGAILILSATWFVSTQKA
ncbi:MAG: DMT family transporter, partial [Verrucomicrobiae bacterium]|nr:DMT family transporter [Verrucomicrobiae bacterium]